MEFNEWVLKTVPSRLIIRLSVRKGVWKHYTHEFTALLLGLAEDVDNRLLLGELWIQVDGAHIVDKSIWTSDDEANWLPLLNRKHATTRGEWKVNKEHVFTITKELQVGSTSGPMPLSNLMVIEYLALLQGLVMNMFLSRHSEQNWLLRNMAFQLQGVRKQAYESVYAGIA